MLWKVLIELRDLWTTGLAVLVLVGVATIVLTFAGMPSRWQPALAILRGTLQLALLSVILSGVITEPVWVYTALVVMFTVAVITSTRRIGQAPSSLLVAAGGIGLAVAVVLVTVFSIGALEHAPRYVLAFGGIVIGGAMTTTTLAGRRTQQGMLSRWDEVEGWLALGATPRRATLDIARQAIREALVPSIDQTKTTGLVTLPGAFVGAIFGGVSPVEAGRFQIVVLAGLMAAGAISASFTALALSPRLRGTAQPSRGA